MKYRVFRAWIDGKEERWLREMARGGCHLGGCFFPWQYTIQKGKPRDVVYRLDT
jgi:hypothetical protein